MENSLLSFLSSLSSTETMGSEDSMIYSGEPTDKVSDIAQEKIDLANRETSLPKGVETSNQSDKNLIRFRLDVISFIGLVLDDIDPSADEIKVSCEFNAINKNILLREKGKLENRVLEYEAERQNVIKEFEQKKNIRYDKSLTQEETRERKAILENKQKCIDQKRSLMEEVDRRIEACDLPSCAYEEEEILGSLIDVVEGGEYSEVAAELVWQKQGVPTVRVPVLKGERRAAEHFRSSKLSSF